MMTVRNIPDDVHKALKARAKRHHRSAEAEMRAILEEAVLPRSRLRMGDALSALGRKSGLSNDDIDAIELERSKTPAEPMGLE
ncbi:FitA-like ribbon-helix-helix domain-containing protein [Halomonas sp. I1]|uniref:FitA-like ribbon-helix-helix domain-containing protein n=1 Tax=Halomonas sp. I1 TaxID=393536 RepID=UPI0028E704DC|nr:Arc family DNA-binding protein [Halomonas sp. I1]